MNRREIIFALAGTPFIRPIAAAERLGRRVRLIGMLMPFGENDPEALTRFAAFRQRLEDLGWTVGRNLRIDVRWAGIDQKLIRSYAADLVSIAPDVILAAGTSALAALTKNTDSLPIVFVAVPDPVGQGLVADVARPGAMRLGLLIWISLWAANGWSCSRTSRPA